MNWHRLSIQEAYELLGTNQDDLSASAAEIKLMQTGPNELAEGKKKSIAGMLLAQFKDVMILILMTAAIISGIIGDVTDTIVILTIALINAFIGFIQEYRAEKAMQAMDTDDISVGDKKNMAFKGTFVTYGRGRGVVIATGMQTELGRIAKMLQEEESLTPLQQRIASFGKKLSVLVLFLCIVFFVAGWLRAEGGLLHDPIGGC